MVALLTPPGRGALATIAVRGPRAAEMVQACLTRPIPAIEMARPWLRSFQSCGQALEELIVALPSLNEARVHCHGGVAACQAVISALVAQGAAHVTPAEWWHAVPGDPIVRTAQQLLPKALTERTALILLDQANGVMNRALQDISGLLKRGAATEALGQLREIAARASVGRRLTEPWRVVIAGRPNAGKSSLLNALLGYQRSITSPTPGTTRDVVSAITAFEGWPVELCDTAGLRTSDDQLEVLGIKRAQREIAQADLILLLVPAGEAFSASDLALINAIGNSADRLKLILVRSKADQLDSTPDPTELAVSAHTGSGLDRLAQHIAALLVPNPPPPGAAMPITLAQCEALDGAITAIHHANTIRALEQLGRLDQALGNS